jgi:uncharacterized protein (DUF1330 family)
MSDSDPKPPSTPAHVQPSREALRELLARGVTGSIAMLNLLRFRDIADYSAAPALAPPTPIPGAEAYRRYLAAAKPIIESGVGQVVLTGTSSAFLIGPAEERWDAVLVARYRSVEDFVAFTSNAAYLAIVGHRTAALADSRLLPISEQPLD